MAELPEIPDPEAYEQAHDEALLAYIDAKVIEDPEEDQMSTDESSGDDEPRDEEDPDGEGQTDIHFYPLPTPRSPSPPLRPWSPLPSDSEDYEDLTPEPVGLRDAPLDDPDTPPHPERVVVSAAYHDWLVGSLGADLAASEARVDELRALLATQRELRYKAQGGRRFFTPVETKREMMRIEMSARDMIRALPLIDGHLVSRREAELVYVATMMGIRDLTRPADTPL